MHYRSGQFSGAASSDGQGCTDGRNVDLHRAVTRHHKTFHKVIGSATTGSDGSYSIAFTAQLHPRGHRRRYWTTIDGKSFHTSDGDTVNCLGARSDQTIKR